VQKSLHSVLQLHLDCYKSVARERLVTTAGWKRLSECCCDLYSARIIDTVMVCKSPINLFSNPLLTQSGTATSQSMQSPTTSAQRSQLRRSDGGECDMTPSTHTRVLLHNIALVSYIHASASAPEFCVSLVT
jgi:hypothetical protein